MSDVTLQAPRFEYVLLSEADAPSQTVKLTFLGTDRKKYAVELSVHCAGLTIAAASAHLGEILSTLPPSEHPPAQPIAVKGVRTGLRDNNGAALILMLESGAELPLEFQRADLVKLSALFAELAAFAAPESFR